MEYKAKYFQLKEFTYSNTAISKGLYNMPSKAELENLYVLMKDLDVIREAWGKPITITSGYRSPELNKAVGGSPTSAHVKGLAADIDTTQNAKLYDLILKLRDEGKIRFDQLIDEKNMSWIHYGIGNGYRNQVFKL